MRCLASLSPLPLAHTPHTPPPPAQTPKSFTIAAALLLLLLPGASAGTMPRSVDVDDPTAQAAAPTVAAEDNEAADADPMAATSIASSCSRRTITRPKLYSGTDATRK